MLVALALALLVGGCGSGRGATSPEPAGGGSGWKAVKVNGVGILQGADFASAKDGWVVGQMTTAGSILATTDGGATWKAQKAKLPELTAVSFANAWDGCAVGYGVVVTTGDGGAHWEIRKLNWAFEAVTFVNARDGWAVGDTSITATTDAGADWKVQKRDLFQDFESVTFANAQEGWVLTSGGAIEATTNGGASWNKQPLPKPGKGYERNLSAITFVNPQCGWVVGEKLHEVRPCSGSVVILDTTDGGATWKEQATPSLPGLLYSVYFADAHDGWAVGSTPFHRKPTGLILPHRRRGRLEGARQRHQRGSVQRRDLHRPSARLRRGQHQHQPVFGIDPHDVWRRDSLGRPFAMSGGGDV